MKWRKLGQLYLPAAERHSKLISHAANPLPIHLEGHIYRIFFSGRDCENRSSIGAVDIDIVHHKIIREHYYPFFEHGIEGSFYADGVSIGNCYTVDGIRYMLFMGWQASHDGHWRGDIGRLTVNPDLTLQLDDSLPFMTSDDIDPISLSYPWVLDNEDGSYRMWYGSTKTWDVGNGEMIHVINSAYSADGHQWLRDGLAVPYFVGIVQVFSRPSVIKNAEGKYDMWFSYRSGTGEKYRIGYADSIDGKKWNLNLKNSGINISADGWDSEMIEYPFVFDHDGQRYMLYNGNGYGKTGFGLAVLESDHFRSYAVGKIS
jgi:hypothetical protein